MLKDTQFGARKPQNLGLILKWVQSLKKQALVSQSEFRMRAIKLGLREARTAERQEMRFRHSNEKKPIPTQQTVGSKCCRVTLRSWMRWALLSKLWMYSGLLVTLISLLRWCSGRQSSVKPDRDPFFRTAGWRHNRQVGPKSMNKIVVQAGWVQWHRVQGAEEGKKVMALCVCGGTCRLSQIDLWKRMNQTYSGDTSLLVGCTMLYELCLGEGNTEM